MMDKKTKMYGHEYTLRGVKQKGNRGWTIGRANADNYRMFAAAAYWNATWSIDPDHLTNDRGL
jgi:hypothetical protein